MPFLKWLVIAASVLASGLVCKGAWLAETVVEPLRLPRADPAAAGMDAAKLALIDDAVNRAITEGRLPGCVVAVVRQGKIGFLRAYGHRAVSPHKEPMSVDTIFDLASLTKPVATATAVMLLREEGRLRLDDSATRYLPEFSGQGKDAITIEQLLLHTSGLIADNPLSEYEDGPEAAWKRICELKLLAEPGQRFVYSDVGYIVLGKVVERISGMPLAPFTERRIYDPLGMTETRFLPTEAMRSRTAPTELRMGRWLRGEVHDPRAAKLGGVAGHAGLFGSAEDLAVFCQMILESGSVGKRRILRHGTVAEMVRPRKIPGGLRALGWDVETAYSSNRGTRFPVGSFGHTGFTGTSLWLDPQSKTAVIFLSNRVHPDGKGNVNRLRGEVATLVADALIPPLPERQPTTPP